jgi:hypothetical protein
MFKHNIQFELLAPVDTVAGKAIISNELSKQDILTELMKDDDTEEAIPLKDDDKKKDDKKSEKKETKGDEEADEDNKEDTEEGEEKDDELKDLEDELDEPDEDKLELQTPTSRREILKKYPKLFKDFPYLETAYYREQEFTKLLPTIADAKEAVGKSETLDKFEKDLSQGNTELVLKAVRDNNPKAYNKLIDNYLSTLAKVDEKAYHHVLGNTIRHTIMAMVQESRTSGNEALEQAATILNQFIFGSSKFTAPEKLSTDDKTDESDEKEQRITERERAFTRQKFNSANEELSGRVNKAYKLTIESKIDPKESMTEYVRKTAVREAQEELESLIEKDTRFKTLVDRLWESAFKNDFSSDSVAKIRSAFLSKAQTLLPSVIQKARNEALKGMGKRITSDNHDDDSHPKKDESKNGNDSSRRKESKSGDESHRRNDSSKSKVPSSMTSLEYLMSDD